MSAEFRELHYSNKKDHNSRSKYWEEERKQPNRNYYSRSAESIVFQSEEIQASFSQIQQLVQELKAQTKP